MLRSVVYLGSSPIKIFRKVDLDRTEPNTGLETLKLRTQAVRDGDYYRISGQKMYVTPSEQYNRMLTMDYSWISSAQVAKKMVLLARTTPLEEVKKPSEGLSLFFIDFDKTAPGLELKKIKKMGGRAVDANEVFFDDYRVPADTLIGQEGQGFKIVGATDIDSLETLLR